MASGAMPTWLPAAAGPVTASAAGVPPPVQRSIAPAARPPNRFISGVPPMARPAPYSAALVGPPPPPPRARRPGAARARGGGGAGAHGGVGQLARIPGAQIVRHARQPEAAARHLLTDLALLQP